MSLLRHPFAPSTLALGSVPLDQDLIALLASSYAAARANAATMTGSFFRRLFLADPALRFRFPSDLTGANAELLETLDAIVSQLNSPRRNRRLFERLSRWFRARRTPASASSRSSSIASSRRCAKPRAQPGPPRPTSSGAAPST